jgi:hypothetical protein
MTGHVKNSGAWRTLVSGSAVKNGGVWRTLSEAWVKNSGVWRKWLDFTGPGGGIAEEGASVSPNFIYGNFPECSGDQTYGLYALVNNPDNDAVTYSWSVSGAGISITSGQGTSSITILVDDPGYNNLEQCIGGGGGSRDGTVTLTVNIGGTEYVSEASVFVAFGGVTP